MPKGMIQTCIPAQILRILANKKEETMSSLHNYFGEIKTKNKKLKEPIEETKREKIKREINLICIALNELTKKGYVKRAKRKLIKKIPEDKEIIQQIKPFHIRRRVQVYRITQAGLKKLKQIKIKIIVPS